MSLRSEMRRRLPDALVGVARAARRRSAWVRRPLLRLPVFPPVPDAGTRLLVGPTNSAGQGWAWARSAERELTGTAATVFAVRRNHYGFPDDYGAPIEIYAHPRWQRAQERFVLTTFSHVLIESMRPMFGSRYARDARGDVEVIGRAGLQVGLVFHGSDVRLPSRHVAQERWSPFRELDQLTERLEEQAGRLGSFAVDFSGPVFVSTPDLLADLPAARWLPVVIDVDRWTTPTPPMQRERPIVVHAPSNPRLKGSAVIEAAMTELSEKGLVEYRGLVGVPHARMPAALAAADIVVDQLVMGLYGVAACEAMAAGRLVVSYVGNPVREHVRRHTGYDVPVVEADPENVADVVAGLVANREMAQQRAARGPAFVRAVHDGVLSASALGEWLVRVGE